MRKVKLKDRKKVRLRNRRPKRTAPERDTRPVAGNLTPVVVVPEPKRKRLDTYEEWVAENPPPDLAVLVKTYGTFQQIPHAAWLTWDKELRTWQARYRTRQWDF